MTDARFPERWLNDRRVLRLSDTAFRTFVVTLTWSVSNRTDGRLDSQDVPLVQGARIEDVAQLVSAGLWEPTSAGWLVTEFATTQTTAAQLEGLERKRLMDRERQARHRAKPASDPEPTAEPVTRDVTRDDVRDGTRETEDRTGKDRQGQARQLHDSNEVAEQDALDDSWGARCPQCQYVEPMHDVHCARRRSA